MWIATANKTRQIAFLDPRAFTNTYPADTAQTKLDE